MGMKGPRKKKKTRVDKFWRKIGSLAQTITEISCKTKKYPLDLTLSDSIHSNLESQDK